MWRGKVADVMLTHFGIQLGRSSVQNCRVYPLILETFEFHANEFSLFDIYLRKDTKLSVNCTKMRFLNNCSYH